jgi:hypothetical protein
MNVRRTGQHLARTPYDHGCRKNGPLGGVERADCPDSGPDSRQRGAQLGGYTCYDFALALRTFLAVRR